MNFLISGKQVKQSHTIQKTQFLSLCVGIMAFLIFNSS